MQEMIAYGRMQKRLGLRMTTMLFFLFLWVAICCCNLLKLRRLKEHLIKKDEKFKTCWVWGFLWDSQQRYWVGSGMVWQDSSEKQRKPWEWMRSRRASLQLWAQWLGSGRPLYCLMIAHSWKRTASHWWKAVTVCTTASTSEMVILVNDDCSHSQHFLYIKYELNTSPTMSHSVLKILWGSYYYYLHFYSWRNRLAEIQKSRT